MSVAVAKNGAAEPRAPSRFQAHKPGEGYATRLATFVLAFCFLGFAVYHWYYGWKFLRDFLHLHQFIGALEDPGVEQAVAQWGAVLLLGLGLLVAYYYIYIHVRASEFLIKTDLELGKVTWPKVTPWFKHETEVWGKTYVVLAFVAVLTLYILLVDQVLLTLARWLFYSGAG